MSLSIFSACPTTIAQTTNFQFDETEQSLSEQIALTSTQPETDSETYTYAYTNVSSTPVRMAPIWTASIVETFSSGKEFNIIHREYDYYYIQYYGSDGVLKRGYVPRSCTSVTVSRWCNHTIFNPGENISVYAQDVYYRPVSTSAVSGTIDTDEGTVSNKPLIVLSRRGNYYFIQYATNTSNTGSEQILWKRGWIPVSVIAVYAPQSVSSIEGKTTFYIQNVATGKYLSLADSTASNKSDISIWEFLGDSPQKWNLETPSYPQYDGTGSVPPKYVTLKTNASNTSSTG